VRDQRNLRGRYPVDAGEELGRTRAHHDEPIRQNRQFLEYLTLSRIRFFKNRVQGGDDRHAQITQQGQNMTPCRTAEDSVLVLQTDDVDVADIQKVGCALIRRQVAFGQLEPNATRIRVPSWTVVDGNGKTGPLAFVGDDGFAQVCRKRGNPAPSREIVANDREPSSRGTDLAHS